MSTAYVILEERADGGLSYVRLYDMSRAICGVSCFPRDPNDRFTDRDQAEANAELLRADNARSV